MQLGPNIWGPHLWKSLHMITMGYPNEPTDEQKKNYKSFFENFYLVIPCSICANNYKQHLIDIPLTNNVLKNKDSLVRWVIDIHNLVNKETGKKVLSYEEAITLISNNFKSNEKEITNIPTGVSDIKNNYGAPIDVDTQKDFQNKKKLKDNEENKFYPLWIMIIILVVLVMIAIAYKKN